MPTTLVLPNPICPTNSPWRRWAWHLFSGGKPGEFDPAPLGDWVDSSHELRHGLEVKEWLGEWPPEELPAPPDDNGAPD